MVECNICGWKGSAFGPLHSPGYAVADPNVFCPRCGSYERHRSLAYYLHSAGILPAQGQALEIGNGIVAAYKRFLEAQGLTYVSLDLWHGLGNVTGDVVTAPFATGSFELAVCSHVLEHVSDDLRALQEVSRIVRPEGLALFQVPYDDTRFGTIEHSQPPSRPIGSGYHYGHVRDYGLDVIERFSFFWEQTCEIHPLLGHRDDTAADRYGFDKNYGTIFVCTNAVEPLRLPGLLHRDVVGLKRRWMIELSAWLTSRNGSRSDPLGDWLRAEREVAALSDDQVRERNVVEILRGAARRKACASEETTH